MRHFVVAVKHNQSSSTRPQKGSGPTAAPPSATPTHILHPTPYATSLSPIYLNLRTKSMIQTMMMPPSIRLGRNRIPHSPPTLTHLQRKLAKCKFAKRAVGNRRLLYYEIERMQLSLGTCRHALMQLKTNPRTICSFMRISRKMQPRHRDPAIVFPRPRWQKCAFFVDAVVLVPTRVLF